MPKVTIVIPVYNVEKYLRQCLDSCANQTLADIQIICVNDGSTDNCLAILQEYAAKDERIFIIDKSNGGQASARNAAYPHIKGKYTLFVDSDDWIHLETCQKIFFHAEAENADILFFQFQLYEDKSGKFTKTSNLPAKLRHETIQDKLQLLEKFFASLCDKLWRSDFLINNDIRCPEGLIQEDNFFFWAALVRASKIVMLPDAFYFYRQRPNSTMGQRSAKRLDIIQIANLIKADLKANGFWHDYRSAFMKFRLGYALRLPAKMQLTIPHKDVLAAIRNALDEDDLAFLSEKDNGLPKKVQYFYAALLGDKKAQIFYSVYFFFRGVFNFICRTSR